MTSIAFHFGVGDRIDYGCRLLRKAVRQGVRLQVVAAADELSTLDQALWTFDAHDFVPHLRWRAGMPVKTELERTPIWLTPSPAAWPAELAAAPVLVNLGLEIESEVAGYERVIEIVSTDDADRQAARRRWRAYTAAGHQLSHHEVPAG